MKISKKIVGVLVDALKEKFAKEYGSEITANLPDYQFYGYSNHHNKSEPSIKAAIEQAYLRAKATVPAKWGTAGQKGGWNFNGKYLRDILKQRSKKDTALEIEINEDYLQAYLLYLEYASLEEFTDAMVAEQKLDHKFVSPNDLERSYLCHYYDQDLRQLQSFDFIIEGRQVTIENVPSGRTYRGLISNTSTRDYHTIVLTSRDDKRQDVQVHFLIYAEPPFQIRDLLFGHFALIDKNKSCSGACILESRECIDVLEGAEEEDSSKLLHLAYGQSLSEEQCQLFLQHLRTNNPKDFIFSTPQNFAKKFHDWKYKSIRAFLYQKELCINFPPRGNWLSLYEQLDQSDNPGWEQNSTILHWLEGTYLLLVGCWEKEDDSNEVDKKIEVLRVVIAADGRTSFTSVSSGPFVGFTQVLNHSHVNIQLKKSDAPSYYNLILKIPSDIEHRTTKDTTAAPSLILKGVISGLSLSLKPRSDKVMLVRFRDDSEYASIPSNFISVQRSSDQLTTLKKIPGLVKFFSLNGMQDRYLQNSNLLFSNILDLPTSEDLATIAGNYRLFRINRNNEEIKILPLRITTEGTAQIKNREALLSGKADRFHDTVVVHLLNHELGRELGMLAFKVPELEHKFGLEHNNTGLVEGILLSTIKNREPFANRVVIRREKDGAEIWRKLRFDKIYMDDGVSMKRSEASPDAELIRQASYQLYTRPYGVYAEREYRVSAETQATHNHFDQLAALYLKADMPRFLAAARRSKLGWANASATFKDYLSQQWEKLTIDQRQEIVSSYNSA